VRGWIAGERESKRREQRAQRKKNASGSVSGWRPFFKTRYGRTGQSTVPVRCTPDSAQYKGIIARGCRCTGHCTVQCPVHTGLSGEPRQRENLDFFEFFYLVPNQTKSQLIITQNNTCWDRYWHPHILFKIFCHRLDNF
jgi:hypothetical protein